MTTVNKRSWSETTEATEERFRRLFHREMTAEERHCLFFSEPILDFFTTSGDPRSEKREQSMMQEGTKVPSKSARDFNPESFLTTIGKGRRIVPLSKRQIIYAQGAECDAIFYILEGKVRLTVVAKTGKEATLGILTPGDFFGEAGLAGQQRRLGSATTMTDCELMRIEKSAMMLALHREHSLSDLFTAYLLTRNIHYEADLVDQLFNFSEKRLARILLRLAYFGKEGRPETVVPRISQETLAEMVGTTRSRVSLFMNRFRKLGFVDYGGSGMQVHSSLLNVVLHESASSE